jgi:hypothetical protein
VIPPLPADVTEHVICALVGIAPDAAGAIVAGLVASRIVTRDQGNEILLAALLRPRPSATRWLQ